MNIELIIIFILSFVSFIGCTALISHGAKLEQRIQQLENQLKEKE